MTNFQSPPPEPSNRSQPWKWVAIGCGGLLGVLILLGVVSVVFLARNVQFSADPAETEAKARSLFTYDIPGGSTGYVTMNMFGVELVQVADRQTPPTILLTVGQFPGILAQGNNQQSFVESLQEGYAGEQGFQIQEQRIEDRQLCDQTVSVTIQTGLAKLSAQTDPVPAVNYIAIVERANHDQFAWIATQGEQAEANAEAVFSSLDCAN